MNNYSLQGDAYTRSYLTVTRHRQSYTMSSIAELHPVERHVLQATTMSCRNTVIHCHTVTVLIDLELVFRDKF